MVKPELGVQSGCMFRVVGAFTISNVAQSYARLRCELIRKSGQKPQR